MIRNATRDRLLSAATHCAYCAGEFYDLAAMAEWDALVAPAPPAQTHPWCDCLECQATAAYIHRRNIAGPPPPGLHRTIDHRVPQCRGGSDEEWNLSVVCSPCNTAKHKRSLWAFLNEEPDHFGPAPSRLTAILSRRGPFGTGSLDYHARRFIAEIRA